MERGLLLLKSHIESFKKRFVHCTCEQELFCPLDFSSISSKTQNYNMICLSLRFAFHLRLWWLEGRGITSHQQIAQRPTEKQYPIRVMCQPAGLSDKVGIFMALSCGIFSSSMLCSWISSISCSTSTYFA